MRLPIAAAVSAAILLSACSQNAQNVTPKTDEEKVFYSMGVILSQRVGFETLDLTDQELAMVKAGIQEGTRGKPQITMEEIEKTVGPKIEGVLSKRTEAHAAKATAKAKEEGAAYLAKAEKEKGATKLSNGVILTVTQEGTGALPQVSDTLKVNYVGKLIDGKEFDSSAKHGEAFTFPLATMIPCWIEALQKVKVGSKVQLVCPADQAYGENGSPPVIPGGSTLVFDVELLEIVKAEPAPAAGAKAPAGAAPKAK